MGPWRAARGHARHPVHLDREHRGCQVLDEGVPRSEDPWGSGILIAVTDGLKGMPEALGVVFPATDRRQSAKIFSSARSTAAPTALYAFTGKKAIDALELELRFIFSMEPIEV